MLNSALRFARHGASTAAISRTSLARTWRSSARGCTVIPGAPASRHVVTASVTLGTFPPRELRRVAILLTLTDRLMDMAAYAMVVLTASAISSAHACTVA